MQLIKSIKVVFTNGKKILYGNPAEIQKGDKILLTEGRKSNLFTPEFHLYEITSIAARMEHTIYIEVRVKRSK